MSGEQGKTFVFLLFRAAPPIMAWKTIECMYLEKSCTYIRKLKLKNFFLRKILLAWQQQGRCYGQFGGN